jgi:short-subunit dehydrogenase
VTPLLDSNVEAMSDVINVNVDALMRLTYAAAPKFVERGAGSIINMSSAVAIGPDMLNGVYGASKAFVLAFSQSLKHELADKGVRIQVVLPGVVATDSWGNNGMPVENLPKEMVMSADAMVDAALSGFDGRIRDRALSGGQRAMGRVRSSTRSVVVRINDRGPFVKGRVIDLSPAAAKAIGVGGIAQVSLSTN